MFQVRPQLSLVNIETRVSPIQLFKFYCPGFKKPGQKFNSEFRDDKNPSAIVSYAANGECRYMDFGDPLQTKSQDVYDYIGKKFGLNFFEVLQKINVDFKLGLGYLTKDPITGSRYKKQVHSNSKQTKSTYSLPVRKIHLTNDHYRYWMQYDLTRSEIDYLLNLFNINAISEFWLNTDKITNKHYLITNIGFSYDLHFVSGIMLRKVYLPSDKGSTFFTNSNMPTQGYKQLPKTGDLLFITSSMKDVIILRACGFYAVAPSNENVFIRNEVYEDLKNRFTHKIILYDNDYSKESNWGKMFAEKHAKKYNIPYILLPDWLGKDPSDHVRKNGRNSLINIIENEIHDLL